MPQDSFGWCIPWHRSGEAERAGTAVAAGMMEAAASLAAEATAAAADAHTGTQSAVLPNPEAYAIIGKKSRVPRWAVNRERSRRQPLVNLNAIARAMCNLWESARRPPRGRGGWAGRDGRGRSLAAGAPSMAENAEKVAGQPPSDLSIPPPRPSAGPSSPQRTLTPAATNEQPPPCPIREPFPLGHGRPVIPVTKQEP